jgi:hypothetical protein
MVNVNRPAPTPPLTSLQAYTKGGCVVESGSDGVCVALAGVRKLGAG